MLSEEHRVTFCFNSWCFSGKILGFLSKIFRVTIHCDRLQVSFSLSFKLVVFKFFSSNCCLFLVAGRFLGIFISALTINPKGQKIFSYLLIVFFYFNLIDCDICLYIYRFIPEDTVFPFKTMIFIFKLCFL